MDSSCPPAHSRGIRAGGVDGVKQPWAEPICGCGTASAGGPSRQRQQGVQDRHVPGSFHVELQQRSARARGRSHRRYVGQSWAGPLIGVCCTYPRCLQDGSRLQRARSERSHSGAGCLLGFQLSHQAGQQPATTRGGRGAFACRGVICVALRGRGPAPQDSVRAQQSAEFAKRRVAARHRPGTAGAAAVAACIAGRPPSAEFRKCVGARCCVPQRCLLQADPGPSAIICESRKRALLATRITLYGKLQLTDISESAELWHWQSRLQPTVECRSGPLLGVCRPRCMLDAGGDTDGSSGADSPSVRGQVSSAPSLPGFEPAAAAFVRPSAPPSPHRHLRVRFSATRRGYCEGRCQYNSSHGLLAC